MYIYKKYIYSTHLQWSEADTQVVLIKLDVVALHEHVTENEAVLAGRGGGYGESEVVFVGARRNEVCRGRHRNDNVVVEDKGDVGVLRHLSGR